MKLAIVIILIMFSTNIEAKKSKTKNRTLICSFENESGVNKGGFFNARIGNDAIQYRHKGKLKRETGLQIEFKTAKPGSYTQATYIKKRLRKARMNAGECGWYNRSLNAKEPKKICFKGKVSISASGFKRTEAGLKSWTQEGKLTPSIPDPIGLNKKKTHPGIMKMYSDFSWQKQSGIVEIRVKDDGKGCLRVQKYGIYRK